MKRKDGRGTIYSENSDHHSRLDKNNNTKPPKKKRDSLQSSTSDFGNPRSPNASTTKDVHKQKDEDFESFLKSLQDVKKEEKPVETKGTPENLRKKVPADMTPLEALNCAWLRLNKEQVRVLEKLCREAGIDPGIHAHSDVSSMDVYAEIRELRKQERESRAMEMIVDPPKADTENTDSTVSSSAKSNKSSKKDDSVTKKGRAK